MMYVLFSSFVYTADIHFKTQKKSYHEFQLVSNLSTI